MKYLYTPLTFSLALISCHLGAMELPNTDTQWADTPAKNVMARFSQEKLVLFGGKEYSATAIQHAYLELLRETSGKDSQFMWNDEGKNHAGICRFKLMHYMTQHYDLQVLLGFGSDSNLLLYGKNYEQTWPIVDANMLSTMESMGVDVSGFIPKSEITESTVNNNQLVTCAAPAPREKSFAERMQSCLRQAYASPKIQSYITPQNAALAVVGIGTALYVGPRVVQKVKTYFDRIREMSNELYLLSKEVGYIKQILPQLQLRPLARNQAQLFELRNVVKALGIAPII